MTQNPSVPPTSPPPPAPPTPPDPPADVTTAPSRSNPLRRVPRAAWLSAAAVVVVLGVGLGGFLLGRATAPDDTRPPFDRGQWPGFPNDRGQGGPDGQGGPGPGGGQAPDQPGDGTEGGAESGTQGSTQGSSADTTAWYVVPQAA